MFPLLAEIETGVVALPWAAWAGIGATFIGAVSALWLAYKSSVEKMADRMEALVREVVGGLAKVEAGLESTAVLLARVERLIERP